ncbi:MAG: tetratricopeptide repeat protein [Ferruginibacter sp.]|nr:tetratricopeptide repeat protein [Cytophagales bacterium]
MKYPSLTFRHACWYAVWSVLLVGAQTPTDSLKSRLDQSKPDTNRVNLLDQLLARQLSGLSPEEVNRRAGEIIRLSQQLAYPKGVVTAIRRQAESYQNKGRLEEAKKCYERALAVAQRAKDPGLAATCQNDLGIFYARQNRYAEAMRHFTRSARLAEQTGDVDRLFSLYINLANISFYQDLYQEALAYGERAEKILGPQRPEKLFIVWEIMARSYLNWAAEVSNPANRKAYLEKGYYYARKGVAIAEASQQPVYAAAYHIHLGIYYHLAKRDPRRALAHFNKSLDYAQRADWQMGVADANQQMARVYRDNREFGRALTLALKALATARTYREARVAADIQKELGEIYAGLDKYPEAYRHYRTGTMVLDTLAREEREKQVFNLQVQFDSERKGFEIERLQQRNQLQEAKAAMQVLIRNGSIAGLLGVSLLLGLLYNRFRLKQRANRELEIKQTEINQRNRQLQNSVEEKDTLLKEIHHRVKNNLQLISSLLSLQQQANQDEVVAGAIRESQSRVKSIALIHEKLYHSETLAKIDFHGYLRDLMEHLVGSFRARNQHISYSIGGENALFDIDTAVRLGLAVNELVVNALKHAFPDARNGEIRIHLTRQGPHQYQLSVADSGVGLPPPTEAQPTGALGLRLVGTIARQLNGQLRVERTENPTGSAFHLQFREPLEAVA